MSVFKRIFGSKSEPAPKKDPENTRLNYLLDNYAGNPSNENYKLIITELLEGNSFLILPTLNNGFGPTSWTASKDNTKLKLTSVYDLDGLKALAAFTDEKSLVEWSKRPTTYTALKAQAVLELCKDINVSRVVLNSGSQRMFVIQRNKQSEKLNFNRDKIVNIGTPANPIEGKILEKLITSLSANNNVEEAYQFIISRGKEWSLAIGIKLIVNSENAKEAVVYGVQDALSATNKETFFDVIFFKDESMYAIVKDIQDALFYKKQ